MATNDVSSPGESATCEPGMFALPLRAAELRDPTIFKHRIETLKYWIKTNRAIPHRLALKNLIGVLYFYNGQRLEAIEWFNEVLLDDEHNLNAIANKAFVYQRLFVSGKAEECGDMLSKLEVTDQGRVHRIARCLAEQAHALGCELIVGKRELENLQMADEYYNRALTNGGGVFDMKEKLVWKFNMALNGRRMGLNRELPLTQRQSLLVKAIKIFSEIIEEEHMEEYHASCWCSLGSTVSEAKILGIPIGWESKNATLVKAKVEPELCFKKATELQPDGFDYYTKYARYLKRRGVQHFSNALAQVENSLGLENGPINCFGLITRSQIICSTYKYDADIPRCNSKLKQAIDDVKYVHLFQPSVDNLCLIAQLLQHMHGGPELDFKALEYFLNAVEFPGGGQNPKVHSLRGQFLKKIGELEHAIESFKRLLETDSQNNRDAHKNFTPLLQCLFQLYHKKDNDNKEKIMGEITFWFDQGCKKYGQVVIAQTIKQLLGKSHSKDLYTMCQHMRPEPRYVDAVKRCLGVMSREAAEPRDGIADLLRQLSTRDKVHATPVEVLDQSQVKPASLGASHRTRTASDDAMSSPEEGWSVVPARGRPNRVKPTVCESPSTGDNNPGDTLMKPLERARNTRQKPYDFFVSHSQDDASWVNYSLLPKLERDYAFKGHIANRDFLAGERIIDNISKAVEDSVCSVLVLTPSFVNSKWCRHEMDEVLHDRVTGGHVIPIKLKECQLPSKLAQFTYLDATQLCDWERLVRNMEDLM